MYLIEVVPLARLPRQLPDSFSYFSAVPMAEGTVVEIEVRQRALIGIVLSARTVKDVKHELRSASFILKKVGRVISSQPILNSRDWEFLKWMSIYYLTPPATILRILIPSFAFKRMPLERWVRRGNEQTSTPAQAKLLIGPADPLE